MGWREKKGGGERGRQCKVSGSRRADEAEVLALSAPRPNYYAQLIFLSPKVFVIGLQSHLSRQSQETERGCLRSDDDEFRTRRRDGRSEIRSFERRIPR